jgi:hypothetical protein
LSPLKHPNHSAECVSVEDIEAGALHLERREYFRNDFPFGAEHQTAKKKSLTNPNKLYYNVFA